MSDCDVCIGGADCERADFYDSKLTKARKPHKCCECSEVIAVGEVYERVGGKWDGEIASYKTCCLCVEIRTVFTCGESWLFECLWDDMEEYAFDHLTTASPCFVKLSAAAKQKVLDRWNKWKFGQ